MRFHRRQLNQSNFGNFSTFKPFGQLGALDSFSNDVRGNLRSSFMNSNRRKISMSQNDPDEKEPVIWTSVDHFINSEEGKENHPLVTEHGFTDHILDESNCSINEEDDFVLEGKSPTFAGFKEPEGREVPRFETNIELDGEALKAQQEKFKKNRQMEELRQSLRKNFNQYANEWIEVVKG